MTIAMKRTRGRALSLVLTALLMMGTAHAALAEGGFGDEKFKVGDQAAPFTAIDLEGREVSLVSYQGQKVVLLNFWGLRCGACIEEMPYLNALHSKYSDQGLVVLGVDTDGVDAGIVNATMGEVGLDPNYTILLDQEFTITDTYTNFLVPLTLVIDKSGIVQYIHTGFEKGNEKDYEEAVVKALGL